jgi:PAS domain S-box-containing protein
MAQAPKSARQRGAPASTAADLLFGGGEMGELIRERAWEGTPLGPLSRWPPSLRTALNICLNTPAPTLVCWHHEQLVLYNDAALPALGPLHPAALGQPARAIFPALWDQLGPLLAEARASGVAAVVEGLILAQGNDVGERSWNLALGPIYDEHGGVGGVFCTLSAPEDSALRRAAEDALRASEQQLRLLTDGLPALISYVDSECCYRFANRTYSEWLGLEREDVVGKYLWEVLGDAAFAAARPDIAAVLTGQEVRFERLLPYARGGARFVQATYIPDRAEDGTVKGFFALIVDLTERKRAEEQLRIANYRFRLAEEAAKGFNYEWDLDTGVVMRSESVQRVLGYRRDDIPMSWQGWAELLHPDDRVNTSEAEAVARIQRLQDDIFSYEYRVRHQDGEYRWVLERAVALRDDEGRVRRVIGQAMDITDRKRLEAERERLLADEQRAREMAEEANRLKDEFLATVSHELRTPLTAFLGYAQLLQSRRRDEDYIARTVERMVRSAKAQAQLIEDLLDVSRIVTGKLRLAMQPIDLRAVIGAALDTVRPAVEAKGLRLEVNLGPAASVVIGDADRLQQVVWNLLSNATKFTPAAGLVAVQLTGDAGEVELVVRDTGQGISPEFLPFVFDRFRQANSTSKRAEGGLGLGLAIVRHLVELHGGTVTAASEGLGRGAAFTVRLPAAEADAY